MRILNKNQSFYCSCKSGYSGLNCERYNAECASYCNSDSICRPNHRGLIGNPTHPLCICSLHHFGPRCYLRNEACKSNPCGLNATCYPSYDVSGENSVICICSDRFYGDRCQNEKSIIQVRINMTGLVTVSVTQFYDHVFPSDALYLFHQQVTPGLPQIVQYDNGQNDIPQIAILKIYQEFFHAKYFILYVQLSSGPINITSTPEECPTAKDIFSKGNINLSLIILYKNLHACSC